MDGGDPKRLRLDSVNSVFNNNNNHSPRPPPPPPPHSHPPPPPQQRHPSHPSHPPHPTSTQAASPPQRHYQPNSLPPPAYHPSAPSHHPAPQSSPSVPPSDLRHLIDPRNIPSPGHRTHGLPNTPVTIATRNPIPQDSISTYRPTPTPQPAPDHQISRSTSFSETKNPDMNWSANSDHRHANSNGYNSAISPPHAHDQHYNNTPPLPPGQQYAQPPSTPYASTPYMGGQYVPGPGQVRRKQVRATQACNHCRSRKQKCDEARPCQFCRENNFDCQYKDVPPPKQDRSMMELQNGINTINETLQNFIDTYSVWKQGVDHRLANMRSGEGMPAPMDHASPGRMYGGRGSVGDTHTSRMPTPIQARSQLRRADSIKTESPPGLHSHASPLPAYTSTPIEQKTIMSTPQPPATPADSIDQSHAAPDMLNKHSEAPEGLQSDHTTPAHLLLADWPQMRTFCQNIPELQKLAEAGKRVTDYPMQLEQDRGLLRIWGIGEGNDYQDSAASPSSPEGSVDQDSTPSPGSIKEGIWGYGSVDHSSPSTMGGETPRYNAYLGGLGPDGKPDFRSSVLRDLGASYHEHIHCLHPFLNPGKLRRMITEFGAVYSPDARTPNTMSPAGVPERLNPGIKRKRSNSVLGDGHGFTEDPSKGNIERSLRNAIVLLVLALGKVCMHKDPLPAPQADRNPMANESWGYSRDSPHSANNSFNSDKSDHRSRNIDCLPGMAYFSYATDILGNQQGGNTVGHAQAMLLAALYLSQFARVLESWSWINNACRICLVLIKEDYPKITRGDLSTQRENKVQRDVYRLNLVKCVYWTCLQLETDILAEMSTLPPTNVSKYQDEIMYPTGVYESFPETVSDTSNESSDEDMMTLFIYSSLIHLRVILNGAHNTLYGANRTIPLAYNRFNERDVAAQATSIANILKQWRTTLPSHMAWDDEESPSTNINIARLRAKYYGGLYMVLRTSLRVAVANLQIDPNYRSDSETIQLVHECIESAIRSTIAFDRVGAPSQSRYEEFESQRRGRLILTNIFGTLHAQFGNMLILAAVYKSPLRHRLPAESKLNRHNLSQLFRRTMTILREVAPNSPVLAMDLKILANVKGELDLP